MKTCEVDFMTAMSLVRRRERQGFILSKFIGRSLILPKGDPVISDMFAYKEGEIRFCGQETRFDSGEVSCGFRRLSERIRYLGYPYDWGSK